MSSFWFRWRRPTRCVYCGLARKEHRTQPRRQAMHIEGMVYYPIGCCAWKRRPAETSPFEHWLIPELRRAGYDPMRFRMVVLAR